MEGGTEKGSTGGGKKKGKYKGGGGVGRRCADRIHDKKKAIDSEDLRGRKKNEIREAHL